MNDLLGRRPEENEMLKAEKRGEYDVAHEKDAIAVTNENGERIAIFAGLLAKDDYINVAVSLPNSTGTRTYALKFDWLLEHLRGLEL